MEPNDRPVFNKARAELGIHAACEAFDELDLTLVERFWALHCMEVSARALIGPKFDELARAMGIEEESHVVPVQPLEDEVQDEGDGEPE